MMSLSDLRSELEVIRKFGTGRGQRYSTAFKQKVLQAARDHGSGKVARALSLGSGTIAKWQVAGLGPSVANLSVSNKAVAQQDCQVLVSRVDVQQPRLGSAHDVIAVVTVGSCRIEVFSSDAASSMLCKALEMARP